LSTTLTHSSRPARTALRVVLATLFPQFAFGLGFAWGGLEPYVRQQAHWSSLLVAAIFALTPLTTATTLLFGGRLADEFSSRRLCWIGMACLVVGLTVAFVLPNEFTFIVFYAMLALGVGYGITLAASLAAMTQVFPKHVGAAGGAIAATYALGSVIQVPIISFLAATHSWIYALRVVGISITLVAVLALTLMPALAMPAKRALGSIIPVHLLTQHRLVTALLLVFCVAPLGTYAASQVATYANGLHLVAVIGVAAVIAVSLGNMLGRLTGGTASDHAGVNYVMLVIVILALLAALILWRTANATELLIGASLAGLAFGGGVGLVPRLATDAVSTASNSAAGLLYAASALGGFTGPLLGTALGGGTLSWLVLGALPLVGLLIVVQRLRQDTQRVQASARVSTLPTKSEA